MDGFGIGTAMVELGFSDKVIERFGDELEAIESEVMGQILEGRAKKIVARGGEVEVVAEGNGTFYVCLSGENAAQV